MRKKLFVAFHVFILPLALSIHSTVAHGLQSVPVLPRMTSSGIHSAFQDLGIYHCKRFQNIFGYKIFSVASFSKTTFMQTLFATKKNYCLTELKLDSFKDRVQNLDLEPIMWKLTNPEEGEGWSDTKVEKIAHQYRMFLYLTYAYPNNNIVPTRDIDKFWHTHILDTQLYIQHCFELFGYYLHHFPYFGARGEQDKIDLDTAFETTVGLFKKYSAEFDLSQELQSACGDGTDVNTYCTNNACDSATCKPSRTSNLYSQRPTRQKMVM